ncbi:putative O-glycosylation ligase, exosortase A system-associated [Neptunomonas japonica]|uniref:Wzy family polymerase n=1 Tax=Neptunomonas japonica JAMM 1380 TaxID=1441457 RepID=A0A7R6SUV9_9GAMM|nr:putative O-glycosylation ligase, exosortase A system-associated [Neptunomonas japonica]BBB28756.1 wzy family polymerase [Neptunomonas japonica JAMM 1380]
MRDLLITLIVFGSIPFILRRPYIGILMWSWLSYMNPHRLAYGFAYDMPFAQVIAITIFMAFVFNKDRQSIPFSGTVVVWVLFLIWASLTTYFAIYPDFAAEQYIRIIKIQIFTFLTMALITNQDRINKLIWVIALSIGFYSIKGGIFTIMTGGSFRVWGPAGSFIEDNNELALACLMVIPLMYYLMVQLNNRWFKYAMGGAIFLSLASVIGSQSRGALIAIAAVLGFYWLKTKSKFVSAFVILFIVAAGWNFMPTSWHERMDTIGNYEEDASAMGRINAWIYSINIANDRLLGGGFSSWSTNTYAVYSPDAELVVVAHSIYFNVLADHGWIGLILFLLVLIFTWNNLSRIIKRTRGDPGMSQQNLLARMLQISFIAYLTGGAFLSLSYFDLPWHLVAITLLISSQINLKSEALPKTKFKNSMV